MTLEGEPGIGKTRLLLWAAEVAEAQGFTTVTTAADEEIRGPFLLARSIVGAEQVVNCAEQTRAEDPLRRSLDALTGRDEPGLAGLPPDQRLLRNLDLAALAIRDVASVRPLALLIDDLQWADDDSLRLLRYVVRSASSSPIFLMLATRPEELAFVNEAVNLIADMERLGLVRRLKLHRFTQLETAEFLRIVLPGKVDSVSAATIHAQSEGVPFVVEELAHTYRDAGMIQEIDGVWNLARNANRLVPSAVRTLIQRRAARLPEETKDLLAIAAVLGRNFSLKDLQALRVEVSGDEIGLETLDEAMTPAVAAGLITQHSEDSAADYGFAHEQVREFAAAGLSPARKRAIHAGVMALLMGGEPAPESLPLLAYHAKAAGDAPVCIRFSLQAIDNALAANAPEEVLRVVDLALSAAATPQDRLSLLKSRDDAFDMLRRSTDRLQGLAEMAALAEALGDPALEMDVSLRRSAALRMSEEWEQAADLARRARDKAVENGDRASEMAASIELGQALVHAPLGEAFTLPSFEVDAAGAEEAYGRAQEIAAELGDAGVQAAALRELGVIDLSKAREWFIERIKSGEHIEFIRRVATGETLDEILPTLPIAPIMHAAIERLEQALGLFEKVGDRRGVMTSIIALAYANWGADIHMGSDAGRHIEEIRRLSSRMDTMSKGSERALAEGQMLYGAHVFALAKAVPDLAITKGGEAYRQARVIGDPSLEFVSAGGTALAHLDLGEIDKAEEWLKRAAAVAAENPTPFRARMLETWRGIWRAEAGDAEGMRAHLERALQLASEQGRPAARCETLALIALRAARLGLGSGNDELLELAERSAQEAKSLAESLPGHPPWSAQSDAALAQVKLARGALDEAATAALSALSTYMSAMQEDAHLEIMMPVAEVLAAAGGHAEHEMLRSFLQLTVTMTAQRTVDEDVRVRWFRGPVGRKLVALAGSLEGFQLRPATSESEVEDDHAALLALLSEGLTNREIAERLGIEDSAVTRKISEMFASIGASSRAEATAFAFREGVI